MSSKKRKLKKARGERSFIYYLNPLNLVSKVEAYGYEYSIKNVLITYVIAIFTAICASLIYQLNIVQIFALCIFALCLTPKLIVNGFKNLHQQKRFADVNKYIEKMLYYFKSSKKILVSLTDIQRLFPEGEMSEAINDAITHIRTATTGNDLTEEGLEIIAKRFPCARIKTLHGFLLSVERVGGDCDTAVELLLEDRNLWADQVIDTQKRKKAVKRNILISMIFTVTLCLSVIYLPSLVASNVNLPNIAKEGLVSWSAVVLIAVLLGIYTKADGKLCVDWLDSDDIWDEDEARKQFNKVVNYDASKEFHESLIWAGVTLIITIVVALIFKSALILVPGFALMIFMLNQHTIGHNLAKAKIMKAIEKSFPSWLMSVSLLLQTENVRVSIRESYANAPAILKPAIEDLLAKLDENPDSETPYNEFLTYFNMPEITDAMSTLYSLSTGAGGNAETEFRSIINRILKMMDRAEEIKNNDKIAVMGIYVTAPSLIGALKLIIDMTALLFAFFAMTSY